MTTASDVLAGEARWAVECRDCREWLPALPPDLPAALVTDPPYGIAYATNFAVGGIGATWRGDSIACDEDAAARDFALAFARSRNWPWVCFGSWKVAKPPEVRGVLIWDKGPAFGMGDLSFPWKGSWEEIYVGGRGWAGHRDEGVLRGHLVHSHESRGRVHPMEKPASLLAAIIRKLPAGLVVIDPFCGSGSTGVAALSLGRRFVGIEIEPRYCEVARRRLAAADCGPVATGAGVQGNLFAGEG